MSCRNLEFATKDRVGIIGLSRPYIDLPVAYELKDICEQINQDADIWVVQITGSADVFCAGTAPADPDAVAVAEMASQSLGSLLVPVVAVLNGDALGAGLELALAADIRLADQGAKFGLMQVSEGAIPSGGGTQRLPRIVGRGKALGMILTAEVIDAGEACRVGLVNKVYPSGELAAAANDLSHKIASKGPIAARYSKEAINEGLDMTLTQGLRLEADLSFLLQTTSDRDEGIKAFMEKRTPEFKGE